MGTIIKFFVAPDHDAAAVVEVGPDGVFESLTFGNFDAEEALIEWESIVTGQTFEDLVAVEIPKSSPILAMMKARWSLRPPGLSRTP
ncbi:hypothetical protein [Streptomyces sp. NPDC051572]|uniref:hypothetical protein n=1 Tax=Streptomyces sp. NPDC051572 TaxID=3155802 RepID=UPI00344DF803